MRWRSKRPSRSDRSTLAVVAVLGLTLQGASPVRAAEFAIIASPAVPVDGLSKDELRRVFALEKRHWPGGEPVAVLLPGSGQPAREVLLEQILHVDEAQLRRSILGKIYRGEITFPPRVPSSELEGVEWVASARNLLAIVPAEKAARANVRILRIDGKRPGEPGYALKR